MNIIKVFKLVEAYETFQRSIKKDPMKWLPSLITLAVTAAGLFQPQLQAFVVAHPQAAVAVGGIYAIVKGLLPSPVAGTTRP